MYPAGRGLLVSYEVVFLCICVFVCVCAFVCACVHVYACVYVFIHGCVWVGVRLSRWQMLCSCLPQAHALLMARVAIHRPVPRPALQTNTLPAYVTPLMVDQQATHPPNILPVHGAAGTVLGRVARRHVCFWGGGRPLLAGSRDARRR